MSQRRSTFLVLLALAGAVATGYLLVTLFSDARTERRDVADAGSPAASGPDGRSKSDGARRVVPVGSGIDGRHRPNSAVEPGLREPRDDPATVHERAVKSERIIRILDEIMKIKDATKRWESQQELERLLREMGHRVSPAVRERLLAMLDSVDPQWRALVGRALGRLKGDVETANLLVAKLADRPDDKRTRHAIYSALTMMKVSEVAPKLLAMLGEGHPDEYLAVRTLGQIGGPAEARALLARLQGGPLLRQTRVEIERVLTTMRNAPGMMDDVALGLAKAGASSDLRRSLVHILSNSSDPKHGELLRDIARNEKDPIVRKQAIKSLGRVGDVESGKVLIDIVQRGDTSERLRAIQAIHSIRDAETIKALAQDFDAVSKDGRLAIMGAAARLQAPGEDLAKIAREQGIHDDDMRVRTASARVLGKRGRDDNVQPLGELLTRSRHPSEWQAALTALLEIGTKRAADEAMSGLRIVPNERQRLSWRNRFDQVYKKAQQRADAAARSR